MWQPKISANMIGVSEALRALKTLEWRIQVVVSILYIAY